MVSAEAASAEPGQVIGDYILHESLGEGGMGEVYRATHRLSGQQVALKRIHGLLLNPPVGQRSVPFTQTHSPCTDLSDTPSAESLSDGGRNVRTQLAQEFQTLASLHHPNIVNVLDYGFDLAKNPFYTMELLESPQTILMAAAVHDVRGKVDLLVQLLHALAYLHRRQILHRDIKPSNALFVHDQIKLVDFGIAGTMSMTQRIAGTLQYMAPELFLNRPASTASDLYSVGVVAFQMFSGRLPHVVTSRTRFLEGLLGADSDLTLAPIVADLIEGMSTKPEQEVRRTKDELDLTALLGELEQGSQQLSAIIGKLLAREPAARYHDALEVIRDLGAALGQELATETSATRESFLQAAEFVGREPELAKLDAALTATRERRGSVWMIAGESGVGKSRLIRELSIIALVRSARVVRSQAFTERGNNYQLWCPVVRALCLDVLLSDADIGVLKDIAPDLDTLLGRRSPSPPALSPQAAQARLHNTVARLLQQQDRSVLLLLEDLHWAGTESLELLAHLAPLMSELPLLIVGNYREDEATDALRSLPDIHLLRLGRLDDIQIARLCESMIGPTSPSLIAYLKRHTEGNVFFLVEMVRALAEMAGQLGQVGNQELPEQLLTGGMERIVQRRLEQIAPAQRGLLDLVAVAGRRQDLKVLEHAAQTTEQFQTGPDLAAERLPQFLRDCANAAVLEEDRGTWQFAHDKIREWVLRHLAPEKERALHRQVAEAITTVYPGDAAQHALLAYHWDKAGAPQQATEYYMKAGAAAARLHAVMEARAHYTGALRTLGQVEATAANRQRRVDTCLLLVGLSLWTASGQEIQQQIDEAEAILATLKQDGAATPADELRQAKIYFWRGRALSVQGEYDGSIACYEQAREQAQKSGDGGAELYAVCCGLIGQLLVLRGQMRSCLPYFEESLKWLGQREGSPDWARVIGFQGVSLVARGQVRSGMALVRRAVAVAKDPSYVATTKTYLCIANVLLQDWPALKQSSAQGLEDATQANDVRLRFIFLWMSAWADCVLGDLESSARQLAEARTILGKYRSMIAHDWFMVAAIEWELRAGRPESAIVAAQEAIVAARAVSGVLAEGLSHRSWARALAAGPQPDWTQVKAHLDCSMDLLAQGAIELELANTHVVAGELAVQRSDRDQARLHFQEACRRYQEAELSANQEDCQLRIDALES